MFKLYDRVWVMELNKPKEKLVYAVVEEMDYWKKGTTYYYQLINSRIGATFDKSIRCNPENVFKTREELIKTL